MLATVAQVEAILGETLDATDTARATELIGLAQTEIEGELGRPAEGDTVTGEIHTAHATSSAIFLDRWPIVSVQAVTEAGEALTADVDYRVDIATGRIDRIAGTTPNFYPTAFNYATGAIEVDYTADTIGQLSALCARIVARTLRANRAASNAATTALAGLRQLTIGRWSATADTTEGADPVAAIALTELDRALVGRYIDRRTR